jgi:hypothetical protein
MRGYRGTIQKNWLRVHRSQRKEKHAHAYAVEPVVVYCSRKDDVAQSAAERFERETGTVVKVVWVDSQTRSGELPARLADDRGRSRADVFWSSDLTTAIALKSEAYRCLTNLRMKKTYLLLVAIRNISGPGFRTKFALSSTTRRSWVILTTFRRPYST